MGHPAPCKQPGFIYGEWHPRTAGSVSRLGEDKPLLRPSPLTVCSPLASWDTNACFLCTGRESSVPGTPQAVFKQHSSFLAFCSQFPRQPVGPTLGAARQEWVKETVVETLAATLLLLISRSYFSSSTAWASYTLMGYLGPGDEWEGTFPQISD